MDPSLEAAKLSPRKPGSLAARGADIVFQCGVLLLCVRFQIATINEASPEIWPAIVIIGGTFALGFWNPAAALVAFTLAIPVLNGLGATLLQFSSGAPVSLAFSGLACGILAGQLRRRLVKPDRETSVPLRGPDLIAIFLLGIVLASFTTCALQNRPEISRVFWRQAVFGWSDPSFFITAAFIWCQGLLYFRLCCQFSDDLRVSLRPALWIWGCSVAGFFLFQFFLSIPEPVAVWAYEGPQFSHGYSLPFDDMHSFGSVCVAILGAFLMVWPTRDRRLSWLAVLTVAVLLILIVLSFARAVWATTAVVLLISLSLRCRWRWALGIAGALLLVVILINLTPPEKWTRQSYLYRLDTLVRLEPPTHKLSSRLFMFDKAIGMIRSRPWAGFGIGSFFLTSPKFATRGDPLAEKPDFAHNSLLQFAAELGVPAALLLAGLTICALFRGGRALRSATPDVFSFAAAFGVAAYLLTQFTAHALNIFPSNQFIFWFLITIALASTRGTNKHDSGSRA